jgi:flagellar protein FliO/FliZ
MTPSSFLGPLAAFVLILALIPAVLWLLKRTPLGGAGTAGLMRVVGALPLSPNQRIVTVEVGSGDERRWLVLGVSPAGIHTLHTLPPQADAPNATATPLPLFAQLLQRQQRAGNPPTEPTDAR